MSNYARDEQLFQRDEQQFVFLDLLISSQFPLFLEAKQLCVVYAQKISKFKQRQSCHEEEVFSVVEEI